jgi:glycosyltransferase involved in cell wall biosynthesis
LAGRWTGFLRDIALMWLAKICGCVTVAHCHSGRSLQTYLQARRWQKWLMRLALHGVDHFLVLSPYWERHFARLAPRTPITVLPNAVRPQFLCAHEREWAKQPSPFTVLYVGEILKLKGVFDLVEAVALLRESLPDLAVRLVGVVGDPDALEALTRRLADLRMQDRVAYVGPRYDDELMHEFLRADVFVLPSYVEGQPVALIEAMATGACVISTSIRPVMSVVTDGVDGLLVPPGNSAALAAAIERVAADPALRAALGATGLRTVRERFAPERFLDDLGDFYRRLLL